MLESGEQTVETLCVSGSRHGRRLEDCVVQIAQRHDDVPLRNLDDSPATSDAVYVEAESAICAVDFDMRQPRDKSLRDCACLHVHFVASLPGGWCLSYCPERSCDNQSVAPSNHNVRYSPIWITELWNQYIPDCTGEFVTSIQSVNGLAHNLAGNLPASEVA